jgi:hypothetical protein
MVELLIFAKGGVLWRCTHTHTHTPPESKQEIDPFSFSFPLHLCSIGLQKWLFLQKKVAVFAKKVAVCKQTAAGWLS